MKTWIALIRGINVGGKNKVSMKELVSQMTERGFANVKTYIQSGNVICDYATDPAPDLSKIIEKGFDFRPAVFTLSGSDLAKAAKNNPYESEEGKTVHFFFCDRKPENVDFELLDSLKTEDENYQLIDKVFYLYAPDGIGRSKLAEKMGKAFPGVTMTARNLNTVNKLLDMID